MGLDGVDAKGGPNSDGYSYRAHVSEYALDRFEVTVGRFKKFVEAYDGLVAQGLLPDGAGANANVPAPEVGTGWRAAWNNKLPKSMKSLVASLGKTSTFVMTGEMQDNRPINGVDWYIAFAFCAWDGGRLPTEAEWEMAASNGDAETFYPWGVDAIDAQRAHYCPDNTPCPMGPDVVGSRAKGANFLGHRDLTGNVSEWVFDGFYSYPVVEMHDYASYLVEVPRVHRGGSFSFLVNSLLAAFRVPEAPSVGYQNLGMRCARDL